ncbi:hypothetical protein [Corynebacterium aurimucosum]|uniref:hypothetical protein n=1 Tax=Corynebacterium aurimucosum TaxID=169292 RepID=UPI00066652A2|nr:hypothetical protein [Corynebacterium aurimucosum]
MRLILMPRLIAHSRTFARVVGVALVGVAGASLSACSGYEPKPDPNPVNSAPITIMIDPTSHEQRVLAEIYRQTLRDEGRAATVSQKPKLVRQGGEHISGVSTNGNFFVGCTGEFLSVYNPEEARAISKDYVAAKEEGTKDVDFLERTHVALMASLPPEVSVVEPAGAEGCPNSKPELPQNYVVVYQDGLFNRDEKLEVASFTKFLTAQDLDEVVKEVDDSEDFEETVRAWMEANLMQNLNEEGDSNSSGGSDLVHEES